MDNEFIMATAKEAERQILWSIDKWAYMSWGIRQKVATEYEGMATLALRVSGLRHKGWVLVSLNEGKDCYEVRLMNVARTKVKRMLEEVYCDNLGEVLDGLIEKDPTLPDDKYRDKAMRDSARKMGMEVIDSPKSDNSSTTNNQNSEDEVMTNETMKVADLIGKSISNGGNAKYTINSIEGDKVSVTFQMGDSEGKPMTMGVAQVEKLLAGGWTIQGSEECRVKSEEFATAQEAPKGEEPKAKTVTMEKPKQEKPKAEQSAKPRKNQSQTETKAEEPKHEHKAGKLVYSAYTNKKGKTCAKVSGFAETDAAYQKEAAASLHGSATYENTKQGRVNFLLFGPRYAEVAKTVCQMLNEGKTVADCQAVVDAATEERAQKREERKQKRETYRQEHEGKAQTAKPQGKTYTEAEMLDLMERVMRGDADALAEVNAIKAKAA